MLQCCNTRHNRVGEGQRHSCPRTAIPASQHLVEAVLQWFDFLFAAGLVRAATVIQPGQEAVCRESLFSRLTVVLISDLLVADCGGVIGASAPLCFALCGDLCTGGHWQPLYRSLLYTHPL